MKNPEVAWLCVFSGSDSAPSIGLNAEFSRGLKLNSVFPKPELATSPGSGPKAEILGKAPRLDDLKLNPGFLGGHELEGPEVAMKAGVCSSPEKSPTFELWENPNICAEEE